MPTSRRAFATRLAALGILPLAGAFAPVSSITYPPGQKRFSISFFTKPLDGYEPAFMADTLAMAGVDGLDVAVRPGGRVEPARVAGELPEILEISRERKLSTEMMVTAITGADSPHAGEVLRTASALGIKHYRMGYLDFDLKAGIPQTLRRIKKSWIKLAGLNQKYGIQAGYQNHSGIRVGAPLWDVRELLADLPPGWISSQFDVRHAVTEGAYSWVLALQLLSKNIGSLAIKDFTRQVTNGRAKVVSVPLGKGIVDFDLYFKTLKELGIAAPISLHVEYPFLKKEEESLPLLRQQPLLAAILTREVDFIRQNLQKFQLI